jgi:hypothetical protein
MLNGRTVACFALLTLSLATYLLRLAEGPAYQPHSTYFWEAMWVVLTQVEGLGFRV